MSCLFPPKAQTRGTITLINFSSPPLWFLFNNDTTPVETSTLPQGLRLDFYFAGAVIYFQKKPHTNSIRIGEQGIQGIYLILSYIDFNLYSKN